MSEAYFRVWHEAEVSGAIIYVRFESLADMQDLVLESAVDPVQWMASSLGRISLEPHGTWIEAKMQPASDDVALRTHSDMFDRGVDVASSAFRSAAFEDSACTSFCSQHLNDL